VARFCAARARELEEALRLLEEARQAAVAAGATGVAYGLGRLEVRLEVTRRMLSDFAEEVDS
jgi:hypothetical protein